MDNDSIVMLNYIYNHSELQQCFMDFHTFNLG